MRDTNAGKLAPTWEGPYRVISIASAGAYYLEDLDERPQKVALYMYFVN